MRMSLRSALVVVASVCLSLVGCLYLVGSLEAVEEQRPYGEASDATEQVENLRHLGRHAEADLVAEEAGVEPTDPTDPDDPIDPIPIVQSYKEVMDGGDDPFNPGCVCCYGQPNCTQVVGRSVDECFPGGAGGDDLSENIAPTTCTQGGACAKRKRYSCSQLVPGSTCQLRNITCCGVATTSGYCAVTP